MVPSRIGKFSLTAVILITIFLTSCNPPRDRSRPSRAIIGCWVGQMGSAYPLYFSNRILTYKRMERYSDDHPLERLPYVVRSESNIPFQITIEIPSETSGPLLYTYQFSADREKMTCIKCFAPTLGREFPGPGTLSYRANVVYL